MIVLIDTCVWVSALLNPKGFPSQILRHLQEGHFVSATSHQILKELKEVLHRPRIKTKYNLTDRQISAHMRQIETRSIIASFGAPLRFCRDERDDHLLTAALMVKAEYLVSRDDDVKNDPDFIRLCRSMGVQILSVQNFLDILKV